MNRLVLAAVAVAVLATAVAVSRPRPADAPGAGLAIAAADKNPWTHLKLNNDPDQFQFAVVSDRTGGHRPNVFSKAVHQINLLQPEFVVSVGDLIEGYTEQKPTMRAMWDEFDSYVKKLEMPFFFVPGNHDMANKVQAEYWGGRYGKSYYHFVYKNALFVAVNSEDGKMTNVTPEQVAAVTKALDENKGVRWTFVFLHKPLWTAKDLDANGWGPIEKALAGRKYTVFCGHVHHYQKFVRNGMNYYQLATTGGGSKLRGVEYGEFDHLTWITMKADGPLLANVMLDGILPEDLKLPETNEKGVPYYEALKTVIMHPTTVRVTWKGQPVAGARVELHGTPLPMLFKERVVSDGRTGPDGVAAMSTLRGFDGAPAGVYKVAVVKPKNPQAGEDEKEESTLPARYASKDTSGLTATVVAGRNEFVLDLK